MTKIHVAALATLGLLAPTSWAMTSSASPVAARAVVQHAEQGVCAGVRGCHVVGHADVDGDGSPDPIGIADRGQDGAAVGGVIVRVKTGPGTVASVFRTTHGWYGPRWQGVANLDGRHGKEIVVGRVMGAHAQFYQVLTWRQGRLALLDAPGQRKWWYIDGAVGISVGWLRLPADEPGTITKRAAVRTGDATESPFIGKVTTYRWARGGWRQITSKTINPLPDARAYRWGGFHIPGLPRW
jgi:hypothetical protein